MKPMATTKTVLSAAASLAASAILARTVINNFLPHQMRNHIFSAAAAFLVRFSTQLTVTIGELSGLFPNQLYKASEAYLSTKISPATRRLSVTKQEDSDTLQVTMERGEELVDVFQGVRFRWRLVCHEKRQSEMTSEIRFFQLSFHKQHRDKALGSYLPYIMEQFKAIKEEVKTIKIHTAQYGRMRSRGGSRPWTGVNLDHPATFETLAMDAELKKEVMEDLERFVRRKDYYRRVGKAWKRGYLLHGPPGTGKSSLIAAMANLLKFDVYDLELTEVQNNSALRTLLLATANRSILVVEDIDCTLDLQDRKEDKQELAPPDPYGPHDDKVTLSGLLNFIDGLWSSCGDERIIVFTTNHKEKLDPALLRPGRMDMHIHMSYCTPCAFKTLLSNYHMVDNHLLVEEIEGLLQEAQATPAEVAEELMKSDILDIALHGLIGFLQGKKAEPHETESKAISTRSGIGRSRNRRTRGGNVTIRYSR